MRLAALLLVLLEEPAVKYVGELAPSPARYELNAKVWAARPLEENLKTVKDRNGDPVMRRTEDGRPEVELATVVNGVFGFHDPGGAEIGIEFEADRKDPQIMFMASWMGGGDTGRDSPTGHMCIRPSVFLR